MHLTLRPVAFTPNRPVRGRSSGVGYCQPGGGPSSSSRATMASALAATLAWKLTRPLVASSRGGYEQIRIYRGILSGPIPNWLLPVTPMPKLPVPVLKKPMLLLPKLNQPWL